jgi:hypothetical protein
MEVGPLVTAGEQVNPQPQLTLEDIDNLARTSRLAVAVKHCTGWNPVCSRSREFADKADGIEIIGTEIVPPFRQTVGLVKDPGPDLPLADQTDKGTVTQLFRRDIENADIAQADAFLDRAPFRQGEHTG